MILLRDMITDLDKGRDDEVEKAWMEESARRYAELKTGKVQPVPSHEVFANARVRITSRRRRSG